MDIKEYIKEKILAIILILFALITIEIFLMAYPIGNFIKIYIPLAVIFGYFIGLIFEYSSKNKYYRNLKETLNELDEKYLITEIIKTPEFIEGKILKEILEQIDKSMHENINKYKYMQEDYKEYIELWIHEVKIPITASKLVIENNKNQITKSIDEELNKIENYTEQALYYARSNNVEKDYYIKKCELNEIVNESIKRNKDILIQEKVEINAHDLDNIVNTDSKWIVFILNQIIQNSVKYRNKDTKLELEFYSKKGKENIILYVKDNGIGIKTGEIEKVFEKGFTGTNGRMSGKKSTGIGLYLCKKLCDKLGISIEVKSEYQKGTEIILRFPINSYFII